MVVNDVFRRKARRRKLIRVAILLVILLAFTGLLFFIEEKFKVSTVYVEGNIHYTNDEIAEYVMTGPLGHNSLFLSLKYRNKGVDGVPFVETMDVSIQSADTIRITVYEKSMAGFVQYLDNYMYFDKDGIVVEASRNKTVGIPQVSGLKFDHVVLYQPLPINNIGVFDKILDTTQLLNKYNMMADKIYFDSDYQMSIYFGAVQVVFGSDARVDEKLMLLQTILDDLKGMDGVLDLSEYTEDSASVTFEPN